MNISKQSGVFEARKNMCLNDIDSLIHKLQFMSELKPEFSDDLDINIKGLNRIKKRLDSLSKVKEGGSQ